MKVATGLSIVSAIFAFGAAAFWFAAGFGKLPPMTTYWNATPSDDPFFQALRRGVVMNRIAAVLAGLSALTMGVAVLFNR